MALGDFPYPTANLSLTHIAAGISEANNLEDCCLSANVIADGLNATYCPGADASARLANLRGDRKQSYFKAYNPTQPPGIIYSTRSITFSESEANLDFPWNAFPWEKLTIDIEWFDSQVRWGVLPEWTIENIEITGITGEIINDPGNNIYLKYNNQRLTTGTTITVISNALQYGDISLYCESCAVGQTRTVTFTFKLKITGYLQTNNMTTKSSYRIN